MGRFLDSVGVGKLCMQYIRQVLWGKGLQISQVNLSSAHIKAEYNGFVVTVSDLLSPCLNQSPLPMVPEIAPIVERLTGEELEEVSPLVLWPNFDEDNIESFPHGWLGPWGTEEEESLSWVLRVCMWATQRRSLARRDLSQVVEAIYAVVVRDCVF